MSDRMIRLELKQKTGSDELIYAAEAWNVETALQGICDLSRARSPEAPKAPRPGPAQRDQLAPEDYDQLVRLVERFHDDPLSSSRRISLWTALRKLPEPCEFFYVGTSYRALPYERMRYEIGIS